MATNEQRKTAPLPAAAASELAAVAATFEPAGESRGGGQVARQREVEVNKQMCQIRRVMMENFNNQEKHDQHTKLKSQRKMTECYQSVSYRCWE